jgi:hypothetical protein
VEWKENVEHKEKEKALRGVEKLIVGLLLVAAIVIPALNH